MNKQHWYRFLTTVMLLLLVISVFARVGGGGGDSSGGGDGDSGEIFELILMLLIYIPFPYNLMIIAGVLLILWLGSKKYKQSSNMNTLAKISSGFETEASINDKLAAIPGFNKEEFLKKVDFAFLQVQQAWSEKKMGKVRRFMSDGVYQRFHVQQLMMEKLEQINQIKKLHLAKVKIAMVEKEGKTDVIHVQFLAEIDDNFISEKYPKLNQSYKEEFIEFWTFVKRRSEVERDIYFVQNCPNCMAPLPEDMGDVCKCPACSTFTNVGDYDWILSEITQPEEFIEMYNQMSKRNFFKNRIQEKFHDITSASIQVLEDKASNAYLQYKVAYALNDLTRIRRFSHDDFFAKAEANKHESFLYNRLYLRDVSMVNLYHDDERHYAVFAMNCREQKVKIDEKGELQILEHAMISTKEYVALCLRKDHEMSGYPVLAHNCSNCGAGVMDSLNINCSFCGAVLNNDQKDWILYDVMRNLEYNEFKSKFEGAGVLTPKEESKIDNELHDIRDYVLNNTMVIMMADGVLEDSERDFMVKLSKKLGYNSNKISELWEHSSVNSLSIMMPDEPKAQQKVYNKMKKAAMADGTLQENEKMILDEIRNRYSLSDN